VARVSLDGFTSFHNQGNSPEPPSFDPRGVAPGKPGLPFILDDLNLFCPAIFVITSVRQTIRKRICSCGFVGYGNIPDGNVYRRDELSDGLLLTSVVSVHVNISQSSNPAFSRLTTCQSSPNHLVFQPAIFDRSTPFAQAL
jgi:hypothetical protein